MRIFAIRDDGIPERPVGWLIYFEESKSFYAELPDGADPWETPLLLSSFAERKIYTVDAYFSKMWVQLRVIPPDRQNIGQILKENHLSEYDEFKLLVLSDGRCSQDDCYIEEISELPEDIQKRRETMLLEVSPLRGRKLLVFFRNGVTKEYTMPEDLPPVFQPVLAREELFRAVAIEPGGYGVYWGERAAIGHERLYREGTEVPISLEDLKTFISARVVNSAEAAETLNCTRQNIDDLIRRGKLHPIRQDSKNKLFLKSEIERRVNG